MVNFCYLFILFIIYSMIGWTAEVIMALFVEKKFVNRGFLIGPYCPIYGIGSILIIYFLKKYMASIIVLFVMSTFICMVLEYFTSYILEKIFKARWWDYSKSRFNINGRICLETAIPFGLGSVFIMYVINPFIENILHMIPDNTLNTIGTVLITAFTIDVIVSFITMLKVRDITVGKIMDNTIMMNKRVKEYLTRESALTRRLIESFPDFRMIIKKDNIIKKIKNNMFKK